MIIADYLLADRSQLFSNPESMRNEFGIGIVFLLLRNNETRFVEKVGRQQFQGKNRTKMPPSSLYKYSLIFLFISLISHPFP